MTTEADIATHLARRVHQGDPGAEAELVERYSRGLLFFLRRRCGDAVLADDLHQDTFRIVLERLRARSLEDPARLAGFLRRTAKNLVIGDHRKRARRKTEADEQALETAVEARRSPLEHALRAEDIRMVRRLIGRLRHDRDRQVLLRHYIAEEDKQTICADLGLSDQHFSRVLFRARQRFKALIQRAAKRQRLQEDLQAESLAASLVGLEVGDR